MQLLEQIANGELQFVSEGIFQSSASDTDYKEFVRICEELASLCKMANSVKYQQKNVKMIQTMKSKHPKSITLNNIVGMNKLRTNITKESNDDFSKTKANGILSKICSKFKLKSDRFWIVSSTYGTETSRNINMWGPMGEDSWINIHILTSNYNTYYESSIIHATIQKRTTGKMKKFDKN